MPTFGELLKEDLRANGGWAMPGFHAVAVYRLGRWRLGLPRLARLPFDILYQILYVLVRNIYSIELYYTASVGRRLLIAHQGGIVVHHFAHIGDDCTIHHNVTIGSPNDLDWTERAPRLGNHVSIGAGAVVVGKVSLGDGVLVGPNAVVSRSLPAGATAFAPPARVMLRSESTQ